MTSTPRSAAAIGRQTAAIRKPTAAIVVLALLGALAAAPVGADVVDRIVLRVNDRIATLLEYERRRSDALTQLAAADVSSEDRQRAAAGLGNRVFRDLFEELLLLSRADQLGINPRDPEIDAAVGRLRQSFGITSEDEFAAVLSQQGMSLAEFREQVREQLRMREVVAREVTGEIKIEEDDLRRIYRSEESRFAVPERRKVRELIVLEADDRNADDLRELAAAIEAELAAGRDLAEIAAEHAARQETSEVIDLGWVAQGELDPTLAGAVSGLAAGAVSAPVAARGGLHIVQVEEIEAAHVRPFAEVAGQIDVAERQRLFTRKMEDYVRELEESAYVRAEPPPEASAFRTVAGTRSERDPFAGIESTEGSAPQAPRIDPDARPEPETTVPPPTS